MIEVFHSSGGRGLVWGRGHPQKLLFSSYSQRNIVVNLKFVSTKSESKCDRCISFNSGGGA